MAGFICGLIPFIIVAFSPLFSQELNVDNVAFEDMGETVEITYNLRGDSLKKYVISLWLSYNKGATFPFLLSGVSGEAGRNIRAGSGKTIIWDVKNDFPEGLRGENFVFAVEAELQKNPMRWPYYVATAGLVGGFIYMSMRKEEKPPPTVGSLSITIPVDVFKQ